MKKEYNIQISNLITLCYIFNKLPEFEKKLKKLNPQYNHKFLIKLDDITKRNFSLFSIKERKFYKENKNIIDIIIKNTNIYDFIRLIYLDEFNKDFFYNYIYENQEMLETIITNIEKLKKLGCNKLTFNKTFCFSDKEYRLYNYQKDKYYCFTLLDNIIAIPNHQRKLYYKTNDSNYEINIVVKNGIISNYETSVKVNSLLFDSNRLPTIIDDKITYQRILNLIKEQSNNNDTIKELIDFYIAIYDLKEQYSLSSETLEKLVHIDNRKKLINSLNTIKNELSILSNLSLEQENKITDSNPDINSNIIEKEKTLYLKRRKKYFIEEK